MAEGKPVVPPSWEPREGSLQDEISCGHVSAYWVAKEICLERNIDPTTQASPKCDHISLSAIRGNDDSADVSTKVERVMDWR